LDLDNTIVPWHTSDIAPGVAEWISGVRNAGIRFCLVTNNYGAQAHDVAAALQMPIVRGALKPMPTAFALCLRVLGTRAKDSLMIGDQLFTDVLGAKAVGMRAIVVTPIAEKEFLTSKLLRKLEAPIYAKLGRGTKTAS
jgi:uncharacterized protein